MTASEGVCGGQTSSSRGSDGSERKKKKNRKMKQTKKNPHRKQTGFFLFLPFPCFYCLGVVVTMKLPVRGVESVTKRLERFVCMHSLDEKQTHPGPRRCQHMQHNTLPCLPLLSSVRKGRHHQPLPREAISQPQHSAVHLV